RLVHLHDATRCHLTTTARWCYAGTGRRTQQHQEGLLPDALPGWGSHGPFGSARNDVGDLDTGSTRGRTIARIGGDDVFRASGGFQAIVQLEHRASRSRQVDMRGCAILRSVPRNADGNLRVPAIERRVD